MAKISTYPADSTPSLSDKLIGSDAGDSYNTKNYLISDILALSGPTYIPYTGAVSNVDLNGKILSNVFSLSVNTYVQSNTVQSNYISASSPGQVTLSGSSVPLDVNGSQGTLGQLLQSNGSGLTPSWVNLEKGSFFSLLTQFTVATTNTVILDQVDATATNGISVVTNGANLTRITFTKAGIYNINLNANVVTGASASGHSLSFYLRKNGTGTSTTGNISNTARYFTSLPNSQSIIGSCYWSVSVAASDYIEVMAINTSATYQIQQVPAAGNSPVCPSVSVSITRAL